MSRTSLPNSTPLQLLLMSWGRGQLPPEPPVLGSKVEGSCFKEGEARAEPCRVKDVNEAEDGWLEQRVQRPCGGEGCGNGQGKGVGGCGKGLRGGEAILPILSTSAPSCSSTRRPRLHRLTCSCGLSVETWCRHSCSGIAASCWQGPWGAGRRPCDTCLPASCMPPTALHVPSSWTFSSPVSTSSGRSMAVPPTGQLVLVVTDQRAGWSPEKPLVTLGQSLCVSELRVLLCTVRRRQLLSRGCWEVS